MSDKIMESARSVADVARIHARESEEAGLLASPVVDALSGTELLRMGMPSRMGGPELDPVNSAEAIMAVAEGDASAAWYPCTSSTHSIYAHYLPEAGAREIFDGTAPVACVEMPGGSAHFTDGGLVMDSGRWPWGSAAPHADWTGVNTVVDGRALVAFLSASDILVEDDWDALGLRATASGHFSVRPGAFVPEHRLVDMTRPAPREESPLSVFPLNAYVSFAYPAVALGNAAGAIADLLALAEGGTSLGQPSSLAESPLAHTELARAEARMHAARAFLLETLEDLWRPALDGATADTLTRSRARLAMSHATAEAAAAVDTVYTLGGGAAVNTTSPLQRRLRDAHTITQHVQVTARAYPLYGKLRFGGTLDVASLRHAI
ncbi:hypothetical protein [Streptomonospora salina]|uniref:Alkylation response protein AidB-like acyl-CoA dehydrogenase n=1 Tax=Streptomonospora salina TaxID=104205 RepID=A0A841EG26_9ACTN|nr:hypothetical protein [Streptomonospora salina]MBB5998371.1 alkylation response protein AidB-like acyl-CoA dehydrogenase [Streptomonospora salina]